MSRLNDLLRQLRMEKPDLADDLQREFDALADRRSFGLNFERHVPEAVELPGRKVRKGDKVRVLPPRGQTPKIEHDRLWRVTGFETVDGARRADCSPSTTPSDDAAVPSTTWSSSQSSATRSTPASSRPEKSSAGATSRSTRSSTPRTTTRSRRCSSRTAARSTAIYIDPPYNTGAKDWKYNNDYVEGDDIYRHSKWLAIMERRLLLAKELLESRRTPF